MTDLHHSRSKSLLGLLLEIVLISLGVFLGLLAEQWRASHHEHEEAQAALRNFRTEILVNEKAIKVVKDYHSKLHQQLKDFLSSEGPMTAERYRQEVHIRDELPLAVTFEHSTWDLALATQSFSFVKPDLAAALARVYTTQQAFQTLQAAAVQGWMSPAAFSRDDQYATASALRAYLDDVIYLEPNLLQLYRQVLKQIDGALGETSSPRP
jgi:hypothetical protein